MSVLVNNRNASGFKTSIMCGSSAKHVVVDAATAL
jgi:hypothetical protein